MFVYFSHPLGHLVCKLLSLELQEELRIVLADLERCWSWGRCWTQARENTSLTAFRESFSRCSSTFQSSEEPWEHPTASRESLFPSSHRDQGWKRPWRIYVSGSWITVFTLDMGVH